ncbi:K02A2.6-like, partial [Cordylochernes scorpioides]
MARRRSISSSWVVDSLASGRPRAPAFARESASSFPGIPTTRVFKWCRKIEASNKKRVNKRVIFDRLPNVAAIDSADSEPMEDLIRRIVCEEVHRALNPESTTSEPSSLKEIIREEIEKNVAAILKPIQRPPPRQSYPNQTLISDGLRRQLKKTMFKDSGMTLKVADGKNVTSIGRCTISLSINGLEQPLEFIVLPNSNPSIILGWDFLEASNAVIDCGRAEIRLEEAKDVLNSPASMGKVVASRSVVIPAESTKLINVMSEELNRQNQPLKHRPYRVSPTERQAIQTEVDKMLDAGIICHSESPWSSPVILVKKKDDDIVVYSKSFNEHLHRLEIILQCLDKAELRLNPKKCLFGTKRIRVFGHLVDSKGIYPDPEKIEAIAKFPTPKSLTDVRSFIGLCSYYRRFIENFAEKAAPLHEVLKKDNKSAGNSDQQDAFDSLKKALMSEPVLAYFEEQLPTELHTDASWYGIGAVLVQINDGKERPVDYASRTLSKAEKNYSTTERECLAAIWAINKFRPYLFGREFVIVTDHHALCWLSILKDPTGRLARWALKLLEYNVTVVYKSGRKHQDADCLSQNPLQLESEEAYNDEDDDIPSITALTCFESEQRKDPKISKLIEETERFGAESKGYEMLKGTLYKKNFDPLGNQHLLVIPKHLRLELLKSLHDAPMAGHLGFSKTYERVKNKYFWPGLLRDIRKYVAHCKECQRKKQSTQKPPGLLKAIPPATSPFQRVGMDLLGRFPKSDTGNKWIIVCTDYLTRFAVTKALPTGEAKEAAKFLMEDVVLKHGAPRKIITDRGQVFQSKLIAELTNQCSLIHRFTTAYHPQKNGLTERLNKTLANMIAMYVSVEQKDWDVILPYVTFAYNTAKQDTTVFTPFKLIHGREAETTVDTLFPNPHEDLQEDYSQKIASRVEETRQLARLETLKAQEKDKARYDSKHEAMDYNVGDLVWIFIPIRKVGLSEKLMKRYFGPYRVTRKLSDLTFEVEPVDQPTRRRQTRGLVHVLRMKAYHDPEDQADLIGPKYFGILRNLVFPEEVDQVPFDKLCKILLKHFNPKTNIIYERFVFQKMDQKSGEAISKYIIRLKEQAQRCNFGDFLQESLRDRFVAGIIDTPTQKKLLQEEGLTFEGALDIALSAESAENDLHNLKRSEDAHRSPQHLHAINNPCKHCGKTNHLHYNCFFKSANCRVCGRVGHISAICYKKDSSARKLPRNPRNTFNKFKKHANDNNPSGSQNNLSLNNINLHPPFTETVYVNNINFLAEIDTGAAITTLTKYEYFKYFKNVKLNKCNTVLTGYSGSKIPILGKAKFDIKLKNVSRTIEILITNLNCSKFLLGRDFLNLFNISFNYLHKLDYFNIDSLLNDYGSIFEYKSDPIKGIKCHLDVKADFIPKFYKFRQVPFALKQLVENEIDKLVDLNILSPIDKSDCASPLVCVAKPNGQIRLCADFKKSLNPYLEDVKYPIPNIESVLSNFQGKKLFTKLDLSKAYHQIEMDDISKKYLVVSTHKGLYKYNRLAFGIKTASEIFQKTMESFFSGINDVYIYFDDILIASEDLESHLNILKRTLNILKENNFTINKNKCLFVKNEIEYLGHKINEFGIYPLKDKLACIKNCPVPKNITELKSFLGFLSFYSKCLPNLSDLAHPLYNLLKNNVKWSWIAGTDRSFNSCKNALDETTCLSHYSLNLPLILSCDASQVGIGATLSHLKDGEERPVCFISRTLNVHERKYSQVEREGLAIVFAVNKLKNYLFGRKFTIYTDHKPLITIFGDKTNLPPLIANRLHRWALTLSNYSFEIKYKKGKDNIIPDFLSRFPEFQEDNLEYNDGNGEILLLNTSIIDHVLVAHEVQLDRTLFKLYKIIETGELPSSPNDDLIPYLKRIDDFTILQECIFLENRMVIPKSLHERVLQILHESHAGTNKMKMMARSSIWWPGMDSSIEIITKNCRTCLSNESLPPQRTDSWPKYAGPWRRVHMDYFNFKNKLFLLAVDSFSSWVEASEVPSTSAYFCINFMRNCIARYGFPQVVVSDNGPPFFSSDFGDFWSKNGISHVTSPPYHPKSNGQAEVSVREVKKLLKKQLYENEQVELNLALSRALFFIRTDVNIRKGTSPAELFLGRKIRSRLSVLSKEEVKASKVNSQYVNSKFKVDETVKFRWITNGHPSWYTGKIIKILGRNVYLIKQGDSIKKVHQNYIRKMLPGKSHPTNMNDAESVPTPISEEKSVTTP